jgi:hypothetical protein
VRVWASRLLLIPLLFFFVIGVREAWDLMPRAGAQQDGSCETVETFTGEGIKQTPPFTVNSDTWRLSYSFESNTDVQNVSAFNITIYNADTDEFVNIITLENPGSDTSFVNAGAGSYYLDIGSANATWEVTVEDCGEDAPPGQRNPPEPESPAPAPPEPRPEPAPGGRTNLESGGPLEPPYPTMMNGNCPPEFPLKKGNGCYPR